MKPLHVRTPLIESFALGRRTGRRVRLKMENLQPAASFKIRGIGLLCQEGKKAGAGLFVSSSGGNAGYAAAYAGRQLGVRTVVFVPSMTPGDSIDRIRGLDAEVRVAGEVWDEADAAAREFLAAGGGLYVPPFDHPLIWRGNSTLVDEVAAEMERPEAVILAVGGGGLLCGVLEGLERHGWGDVPVIAAETEGTASYAASLRAGRLVTLEKVSGAAHSLGARTVAARALEWAARRPIRSAVVSDAQALEACLWFADEHRCLVEPACGAALAVARGTPAGILEGASSVLVVVCGGMSVDRARLQEWEALCGE